MSKTRLATLIALAGCAAAASAQDSVSNAVIGLPGDGLDPYTAGADQVSAYVVDLRPLFSSWGNTFGIAPITKTAKSNALFYNNLMSANSLSQTILTNHAFASGSYSFWDAPGGGVNATQNVAGVPMDPSFGGTVTSSQMAAVFADFDQGYNGVTGSIINFNPMEPTRLFVTRVNAAVNGADATENTAQFGVGSADANGDVYFRADDFGLGLGNPITGQNIFRVRTGDRNPGVTNHISGSAATLDGTTTDHPVVSSGTVHIVPTNIPADAIGGPQGMYVSPTFGNTWSRGFATTSADDGSHLAGSGATGQRGAISFSPARFMAGSVGTITLIGRNAANINDRLVVDDVDATGTVLRSSGLVLTFPMTDPVDAFTLDTSLATPEPDNYHGSAAFRGGVGQTAVGLRSDGQGIAAATVYYAGLGNADPYDAIIVGDFDPANPSAVNWTVAAWTNVADDSGKPIKDGPGGNTIGTMVPLFLVTGGAPLGPSISSPAIDSAGNIWFIGGVALDKVDDQGVPFVDFDAALIRAVFDPTSGGYELERILEPGFVRTGLNSCTPYQVQFLGVAGASTVSNSTVFSNSINQSSWNNIDISGLTQDDPRTLGGIVVSADITYDRDGDGDFDDPTSAAGDPTSADESYQVLLYIGNIDNNKGLGWCPADLTGSVNPTSPAFGVPDGAIDANDFFFYLGQFAAGACDADLTGTVDPNAQGFGRPDGIIDANDFFFFLGLFSDGCP